MKQTECHSEQSARGSRRKDAGFTLIELMIVISIIGILSAAGVMTYMMALNRSRVAACKITLHTIQKGLEEYNSQIGDYPQSAGSFDEISVAMKDYVTMSPPYICYFISYTYTPMPIAYELKTQIIYNIANHGMFITLTPSGITEQKY